MTSTSKLVELRRKTDRQLLITIQRDLDRSLILASVVATKASPLHEWAEKTYQRARFLLTKLDGVLQDEQALLESKLAELRAALDQVPPQKVQRHTAALG